MAQLFGKNYQETGSSSSPLLLRSNGEIKLQWGNKFIDLIKNGKLNSESKDYLFTVDSSDNINTNGIYLVNSDNSVWININGTKYQISDAGNSYVSFMTEQEATADQKHQALSNIGFYYSTLIEATNAGLSAGIIYNEADNKLYIIKDNMLQEYSPSSIGANKFDEIYISDMHIYQDGTMRIDSSKLSFFIDGKSLLVLDKAKVTINSDVELSNNLTSYNYIKNTKGWSLYHDNNRSILEVDSLNWRNIEKELPTMDVVLDKATLYSNTNIIKECVDSDGKLKAILKYSVNYQKNDYVAIFTNLSEYEINISAVAGESAYNLIANQEIPNNHIVKVYTNNGEVVLRPGVASIGVQDDTTINSAVMLTGTSEEKEDDWKEDLKYNITFYTDKKTKKYYYEFKILSIDQSENSIILDAGSYKNELIEKCYNTKICSYRLPIMEQYNNYIALKDLTKYQVKDNKYVLDDDKNKIIDESVRTKIGYIADDEFKKQLEAEWEEDEKTETETETEEKIDQGTIKVGIYSDNLTALNPQLYNATFKRGQKYPRYDEKLTIPKGETENYKIDKRFDTVVPTLAWIKQLMDLAMPIGSIIAWHGEKVPDGWSVCDGTNGTPNLIGKFIKADTSEKFNETDLDEDNYLQIKKENLPKHSHTHTHIVSGSSTDSVYSQSYSDVAEATETSKKSVLSGIRRSERTVDLELNISEDIESEQTWENEKIKVEPHAYSLVFIMKYKNLYNVE